MSTGQPLEVAAVASASLFTVALGLHAPWDVSAVDFGPEVGRIDFRVGFLCSLFVTCAALPGASCTRSR